MSQIEITPTLLSDLRQKAEAAGGRPWEVQDRRRTMRSPHYHIAVVDDYWQDEAELLIAETIGGKGQKVWANAAHIAAASPAVVLALVAEVERLNFALDELLCQFDYQNNPKWRAGMKESMIEMAKKKQDMRQSSGNETDFVTKKEASNADQA
jgi:hypothetical protein